MGLKHEDITGAALAACFDVHNELGGGFLESVYGNALAIALEEREVHFRREAPLSVLFRGETVGKFVTDFLLEDKVVLETKAVKALIPEHQAQVINYLKATGVHVGLLVNFGSPRLEYKRLHGEQTNA